MSMSERMTSKLVTEAFKAAAGKRNIMPELVHHSDQGAQYTSQAFTSMLQKHGVTISMSARGNCYDNAVVESFFHTLKTECTNHSTYQTRDQAKQEIFDYVELFYNGQRKHSYLDYMTPLQFEKRLAPLCLSY